MMNRTKTMPAIRQCNNALQTEWTVGHKQRPEAIVDQLC